MTALGQLSSPARLLWATQILLRVPHGAPFWMPTVLGGF